MAVTTLLSSITRSSSYPITQTLSASANCGTFSLILTSAWTEQMLCELPVINLSIFVDTNIRLMSVDIDMRTLNTNTIELSGAEPYSIPVYGLPTDFTVSITPLFDKYALSSHNTQVEIGHIEKFNTSAIGIVDTDMNDYSSELWLSPTQTFNVTLAFDDTNISSSSGGGGSSITVDTQVIENSTNPVAGGAVYSFVNSSVSTETSNFIGTFNSLQDLEDYSGTVTNNDYAFVISTDSDGNTVYNRYKWSEANQQWNFEYALNNSSFTVAQWTTIQSGLTSQDHLQATQDGGITITPQSNYSSIEINPATTTTIGVVVGDGLSVTNNGTVSVKVDDSFNSISTNPVQNALLTELFTPMTQQEYDDLQTKPLPLYFIYEQ